MTEHQVIRLSGAPEIASAIPVVLGYHPSNRIIQLCLTEAQRGWVEVGPLASAPLPDSPTDLDLAPYSSFHTLIQKTSATAVILAVFADDPVAWEPFASLLCASTEQVQVLDSLYVSGGTVGSYLHPHCPAVPYEPTQAVNTLSASEALRGRAMLTSRAEISHALDPAHTGNQISAFQLSEATSTMKVFGDDAKRAADNLFHRMVQLAERGQQMPEDEAADLVAAINLRIDVRDHVLRLAVEHASSSVAAPAAISGLILLTGRTPDDHAPAIATVLAMAAYRSGDGALAVLALERASATSPGYALAELMTECIFQAMPPAMLDTVVSSSAD